MLVDALQHHRRGDELRQPIEMKRRVGSRRRTRTDVLLAKRLLPQHTGIADEHRREARNPSLCEKGFEVRAEQRKQLIACRRQRGRLYKRTLHKHERQQ